MSRSSFLPGLKFLSLAVALLATALAPLHGADAGTAPAITVTQAWARWLPNNLPAAGYMVLHNAGTQAVALTGATSPDFGHVMLHESYTTAEGANRMRHVDQLPIAPGAEVALRPGSYHLMLMRAKHAMKPGDTVTVILQFADGSTLPVELPLKPAGTSE
jgi:copper(I)-binding protein